MDTTTIEQNILKIINDILKNKKIGSLKSIKPHDHLWNDIGLNSLDLAELTVKIEAEFDIDIFKDGIVYTIGEIFERLK